MGNETDNAPEPRFLIRRAAPTPMRLSGFGLARTADGQDLELGTIIEAELTVREFNAMFGPAEPITRYMIHRVTNASYWEITITHEHVMHEEGLSSTHSYAIRSLLRKEGQTAEVRPLDVDQISPEALRFLLEMRGRTEEFHGVSTVDEMERLDHRGLRLQDFCTGA